MPGDIHILTNTYTKIDPWFGREHQPVELDLGCGKGGFVLELARRKAALVLGTDVMLGRLRKVARKAEREGLGNVEFLRTNSLDLIGYQLPDNCVQRIHLLCPDPWPKARHRHRRLATTDFLTRAARVLEDGGIFHFATDDEDYRRQVLEIVEQLPCYIRDVDLAAISDVLDIETEFERRWREQGRPVPHDAFQVLKADNSTLIA